MATKLKDDPAQLTVRELFLRMRPAQIWGVGASLFALVAASFGLGTYVSSLASQADSRRIASLEQRARREEPQREFLARYLRYALSDLARVQSSSEGDRSDAQLAERMFVDLLCGWWKAQNSELFKLTLPAEPISIEMIRKGEKPTDSRVAFSDGTEWKVPPGIKAKILSDERCRAS